MDARQFDAFRRALGEDSSHRAALRRLAGGGAAVAALGVFGAARAQDAAPMAAPAGWRSERLEVLFTPRNPVSVTVAGGGPPQRGDHFFVDAPIYAVGDLGGTQIGVYQCFGVWTAAATGAAAPDQRLTTVQFHMNDGSLMGLINEAGKDSGAHVGAVQGGTGRFAAAQGTFQQLTEQGPVAGTVSTPGAAPAGVAAPGAPRLVVRAVFDLILPQGG